MKQCCIDVNASREIGGYTSVGMRLLNIAIKGQAQFPVAKDGHAMETDQIVSISLYTEYNYSSNLSTS